MIQCLAPVTARLEVLPGVWQVHAQAPEVARAAQPGQFVMALRRDAYDPYLRAAVPLHKIGAEHVALLLEEPNEVGLAVPALDATLDLLGPFGHGFALDRGVEHLLLVAQEMGIAPLLALAERALAQNIKVTLFAQATRQERLYPADLLPVEIEYRTFLGDGEDWVDSALREALPWADGLCVAASPAFYRRLGALIMSDPVQRRAGLVQVWWPERIGCGMGLCLTCVTPTRHGPRRTCTDGPVFDLYDLL